MHVQRSRSNNKIFKYVLEHFEVTLKRWITSVEALRAVCHLPLCLLGTDDMRCCAGVWKSGVNEIGWDPDPKISKPSERHLKTVQKPRSSDVADVHFNYTIHKTKPPPIPGGWSSKVPTNMRSDCSEKQFRNARPQVDNKPRSWWFGICHRQDGVEFGTLGENEIREREVDWTFHEHIPRVLGYRHLIGHRMLPRPYVVVDDVRAISTILAEAGNMVPVCTMAAICWEVRDIDPSGEPPNE